MKKGEQNNEIIIYEGENGAPRIGVRFEGVPVRPSFKTFEADLAAFALVFFV
jgi:hypothetical protein